MGFREKMKKGDFTFTVEVEPPKGTELSSVFEKLNPFKDRVDAYNVTDMQSSVMRMSSWAMALKLKEKGFEPILQVTCRDRNILALQGDLLGAASFGIKNLLLLTGDSPSSGDHPQAKPVFDLDSIGLINLANKLNSGFDWSGNKLKGEPDFFIGAALNPFSRDIDKEISKLEEKIKAGASFFQTQPIFDVEKFYSFVKKVSYLKPKIMAGIIFLKSSRSARYLNDKVEGIEIPAEYIKRLESSRSFKEEMRAIIKKIISDLKSISCGIHIMPLGMYDMVSEVLL